MSEATSYKFMSKDKSAEQFRLADKHLVNMLLMQNPNDGNYEKLRDLFISLNNNDEEKETVIDFLELCQQILKTEWDRLNQEIDEYKA